MTKRKVALSRLAEKKGGDSRAAKSEGTAIAPRIDGKKGNAISRQVVGKRGTMQGFTEQATDTSIEGMHKVLKQIKTTKNPSQLHRLSDQLHRIIFSKQYEKVAQ